MNVSEIKSLEIITSLLARLRTAVGPCGEGTLEINITATQEGDLMLTFYTREFPVKNHLAKMVLVFEHRVNDKTDDYEDCLVLTEFQPERRPEYVQFYNIEDLEATVKLVDFMAQRIANALTKKETT